MIRRKLFKTNRIAATVAAILSTCTVMVGCASQESTAVAATATLLETESAIETQSEVIPEDSEPEKDEEAPVITVTNTHIEVIEGTAIDLMSGVSASDEKDGDLTDKIGVSAYDASSLDVEQTVTYTVADEAGNDTTATAVVLIKSNPIEALDKTMYSTSSVNVRATSNQDGEKLGSLAFAQEVHVTGKDKTTGWYQIEYNGGVGYVSNAYLADTKPAPKPAPAKPSNTKPSSNKAPSSSSNQGSGGGGSTSQSQPSTPTPAPQPSNDAPPKGGYSDPNGGFPVCDPGLDPGREHIRLWD